MRTEGFMKNFTISSKAVLSATVLLLLSLAFNAQTKSSRSRKSAKPSGQDSGGFLDRLGAEMKREARLRRIQGWRYAGETGDYFVSYNIKTATHTQENTLRVWTEFELSSVDENGDYILPKRPARLFGSQPDYVKFEKSLKLFEIQCRERQLKILLSVDYDEEGKQIRSTPYGDRSASVAYSVPGSIGESILEGACRDLGGTRINGRVVTRNSRPVEVSSREIARRSFPSVVLLVSENERGEPISLGSGFFVQRGLVATSNHVISHASRIYVKVLTPKSIYAVEGIAGVDKERDLAILRVAGIGSPLPLGNVGEVAVGDPVYAIGNPEGLEGTFSQGVVSALRGTTYIQITAPISAGSSGGPILNSRGEVIGIATAIFEGGQNLNFAIPVSHLSRLMSQLSPPTSKPR